MNIDFNKKIVVYGDIMLDKYMSGNVTRISPEAPVPVIKLSKETKTLGGAGNVANNLSKLGCEAHLIGFIGQDNNGKQLLSLLKKEKINFEPIFTSNPTITKIRIIGGKQQIARIDIEETLSESNFEKEIFLKNISNKINKDINVFIISDYLKGSCNEFACKEIITKCNELNIPVIIDPKGNNWAKYRNAFMLTPNLKELEQITNNSIINNREEIIKNTLPLLDKYNLKYILVTRSEKGMLLLSKNKILDFPTEAKEVYDVSGAGDTVISTISLGISSGMSIEESVKLANIGAGIVVSKSGTTPLYKEELLKKIKKSSKKILSKKELTKLISDEKLKNKKIVFTNGCFDILHKGHLNYLKDASKLGDILIVAINSDKSIKKLKGKNRPINNEVDRAEMLSFFDFINYIVIFSEETPFNLLKDLKPNILVKGGDYVANNVIGKEFANEVKILPFVEGYSTSSLISKLKD
jgi:D-beta-D-heptose 7-phosphate kinase / D-beta-D-heptose 1-phosphate adenosyltransferase